MSLLPFKDKVPKINSDCFIAPNSTIIGDVEIGSLSSVWFGTIIRGDVFHIRVGSNSNIVLIIPHNCLTIPLSIPFHYH